MGLLLEFFIAFFGVPWLLYKFFGSKRETQNDYLSKFQYEESKTKEFYDRYGPTETEYLIANSILQASSATKQFNNKKSYAENLDYIIGISERSRSPDIRYMHPEMLTEKFHNSFIEDCRYVFGYGKEYSFLDNVTFLLLRYPHDWNVRLAESIILSKIGRINKKDRAGSAYGFSVDGIIDYEKIVRLCKCVGKNLRDAHVNVSIGVKHYPGDKDHEYGWYSFRYMDTVHPQEKDSYKIIEF